MKKAPLGAFIRTGPPLAGCIPMVGNPLSLVLLILDVAVQIVAAIGVLYAAYQRFHAHQIPSARLCSSAVASAKVKRRGESVDVYVLFAFVRHRAMQPAETSAFKRVVVIGGELGGLLPVGFDRTASFRGVEAWKRS